MVNCQSKFIFIHKSDDSTITLEFEAISCELVAERFKDFLLACQFHPDSVASVMGNEEKD